MDNSAAVNAVGTQKFSCDVLGSAGVNGTTWDRYVYTFTYLQYTSNSTSSLNTFTIRYPQIKVDML